MSAPKIIKVKPGDLIFKIGGGFQGHGFVDGEWDIERRVRLSKTDKAISTYQRFVLGMPWEQTVVFQNIYGRRFGDGQKDVRGVASISELAAQYYERMDRLFESLRAHGFVQRVGTERCPVPHAFEGRGGEIMLGNNGNHRVAMAKILDLPFVLVEIRARHASLA